MDIKQKEAVLKLVQNSKKRVTGRTAQKELSSYTLVASLFKTFDITSRKGCASPMTIRSRVQEIISNNVMPPSGRLNSNNFFDDGFLADLNAEFVLKAKPG